MPWVEVPQVPSMAPPRVGTLSQSTLVAKLNRLPRKPRGGPFACDTVRVSIGTQLIL
jgi:hypothetical protein